MRLYYINKFAAYFLLAKYIFHTFPFSSPEIVVINLVFRLLITDFLRIVVFWFSKTSLFSTVSVKEKATGLSSF
jgi:hypothetical protein